MTTTLKTEVHPDWKCWIAYDGATPEDSNAIGEGSTRENAIADFWFSRHKGKTGSIVEPISSDSRWLLSDGNWGRYFDTREEAVAFAEENQYLASPFIKQV